MGREGEPGIQTFLRQDVESSKNRRPWPGRPARFTLKPASFSFPEPPRPKMKLLFCIVLLIAFACAVPAEARLSTCTCKGAKRCTSHVQCDVCANELFCSSGKCTSTLNEAGGTTRYRSRHTRFGAGKDAGDRGESWRIKNNALMRTAKKLKKRTLRKRRAQRKRHFNLPQYRVRVIEQCPPQLACLVTCSSCTSHLHSFGVGLTLVSLAFEVHLQSSPSRWLAAAHSALKEKKTRQPSCTHARSKIACRCWTC